MKRDLRGRMCVCANVLANPWIREIINCEYLAQFVGAGFKEKGLNRKFH